MKTVCIMQPTYLPWMGYLDMIDQADLFVLLDTVAVSRQSWQTRNRVLDRSGSVVWLPIPNDGKMGMPLNEVRLVEDGRWRRKHARTIASLGGHVPLELLECYEAGDRLLVGFTWNILSMLCRVFGITTPIVPASHLDLPDDLGPNARILAIFDTTEADVMLSTQGGRDYGVPTRWHEYEPAPYRQNGKFTYGFVSHMSVVDCLARHGPEETLEVIRAGRKVPV